MPFARGSLINLTVGPSGLPGAFLGLGVKKMKDGVCDVLIKTMVTFVIAIVRSNCNFALTYRGSSQL